MIKIESSVKQIPYAQETVYKNLSDLSHLERLK
ncbi:MAG: SRPBCC family protein, partial [Prevotella sp.]|nr:SRPBCC family protein [Prevotella sp.]